jgi:hypothetical protein
MISRAQISTTLLSHNNYNRIIQNGFTITDPDGDCLVINHADGFTITIRYQLCNTFQIPTCYGCEISDTFIKHLTDEAATYMKTIKVWAENGMIVRQKRYFNIDDFVSIFLHIFSLKKCKKIVAKIKNIFETKYLVNFDK